MSSQGMVAAFVQDEAVLFEEFFQLWKVCKTASFRPF
jgi:hypothetical protein